MSAEEADRVLNSLVHKTSERDPLTDETGGVDPLSDEGGDSLNALEGEMPETALTDESEISEGDEPAVETEAKAEAENVPVETDPPVRAEADGRKRVNIFRKNPDGSFVQSELTRRALVMADEEGIDVLDALKALGGASQLTSEVPAEAEPAVHEKTAADINTEIATLREERKAAKARFDDAAKDDANEKIEELLGLLPAATLREVERNQSQRQTQDSAQRQVQTSFERAAGLYPDVSKDGSALNLAIQAETARLSAARSAIFSDPEWPEIIATKVANKLAVTPRAAAAKPATVVAPKPVAKPIPTKRATAAPSPGAVSGAAPPVDQRADLGRRIEAARSKGDSKALDSLMQEAIALEGRRAA